MSGALLFANLGAEEGEGWRRFAAHARVREAAQLWLALFPADARVVASGGTARAELAPALAHGAASAALPCCDVREGLVPWLSTPEAAAEAERAGVPLAAAEPARAAAVHDKAFALERARERGLLPAEIADTAFALGPDDLADAQAARARIERAVARWPAALRARFVLKPRSGTSGRGRLPGRDGALDPDRLRGALPRLRARGGCVIEPWLERSADLSVQLEIAASGAVRVLASFVQLASPAGAPVGHRGLASADGSARSGSRWDEELREAALAVAGDAARAGYTGVCGVDAFSFRAAGAGERLRPVVELNARFTAGTSAAGLLARAARAGLRCAGAFYLGLPPAPFAAPRSELFAAPAQTGLWLAPG